MNFIKLFLLLSVSYSFLEAKYCVQVLSTPADTKNFIVNEAKSVSYAPFSKVRVEQRGHYFVLRVGDYKRYQDGQKDAYKIRRFKHDAFLRKCTIEPQKLIYSRDRRSYDDMVQNDRNFQDSIIEQPVKKNMRREEPVVKYKDRTELRSPQESKKTSVWEECKRCFSPVYEDDTTENRVDEEKYQQKSHIVNRQTKTENIFVPDDEVEVQIENDKSDDDKSFWSEIANDAAKNKQHNNHSNIDNSYLP